MKLAIEGNIGAGKSTIMKKFHTRNADYPVKLEPIEDWTKEENLLQKLYESPKEYAFIFELNCLIHFAEGLRTTSSRIQERSIHAVAHVFSKINLELDHITAKQYKIIMEVYEELRQTECIDAMVYLKVDPSTAYARMKNRNRREEAKISIDYIRRIDELYESMIRNGDIGIPVMIMDGTLPEDILVEKLERCIKD